MPSYPESLDELFEASRTLADDEQRIELLLRIVAGVDAEAEPVLAVRARSDTLLLPLAATECDLYEAAGQAAARGHDTSGALFNLTLACVATGRYVEALDAGLEVLGRLDGEAAEQCQALLDEARRSLAEREEAH
jgi:hypothetical protein